MKKSTTVLFTAILLTACSSGYSVKELEKDEAKLGEVLAKCMAGEYEQNSSNCKNAQTALENVQKKLFGQ